MPRAIAVAVRQQIIERRQAGASLGAVATEVGLGYYTVRTIWRRYQARGPAGLGPDYGRCGWWGRRAERRVERAALMLRRRHPRWGAGLIRVLLVERWPQGAIPSARTLQRWFRAAGLVAPRRRRLPQERDRAHEPHAVWQMDATEGQPLASGERVSWLAATDECSGAQLGAAVFPPALLRPGASRGGARGPAGSVRPLGTARTAAGR
jgi:transposase